MIELFPKIRDRRYAPYAGIGSRETPLVICGLMEQIGDELEDRGYTLRSGAAGGADSAFEERVEDLKEIYLPWVGFNGRLRVEGIIAPDLSNWEQALEISEEAHPNWGRCSEGARKLLTRNVYQVLGKDLDTPCEFIICWTKDGKASGGTGQALRMADVWEIPVFNLRRSEDLSTVCKALGIEKPRV